MDWSEESTKALYTEIGNRVRLARKESGRNQADLAAVTGLTRSSIANLEAGRQRPPVHIILLIAQALQVPASRLLPTGDELVSFATIQTPELDLEGQSSSAHDFVTTAIRRATGG
ncbi:helix-turn-helix transcriptional regulator [Streptosporangium algeriense]|uniref:Helix-turn-helix transcriptional regulator n=1 Tax=Streptosporangium algeriense TaxID=1682748 RepID=A0ABW3DK74_9ACTN